MKVNSLADQLLPKRFQDELERIFDHHNGFRADAVKSVASIQTQRDRRQVIRLSFAQLREMGYRLQHPKALGEGHVKALTERWQKEGLVANTLHTRIANLSAFATWIGKPGMVKRPCDYFPEAVVRRTSIAQENRAWAAHGVDPEAVIASALAIDEYLALHLALDHQFGFRVKESLEFRPADALMEGGAAILVYSGTKGGRPRIVPFETPEQRATFEWALRVAARRRDGRIRWPGLTYRQARRRFYYLLTEKMGVNKAAMGVTAHGLRAGCAQRKYRRHTGLPTPIEGGALGKIDYATHQAANMFVSRAMGHGRTEITATYYGSYGHALRSTKKAMTAAETIVTTDAKDTVSATDTEATKDEEK